MVLLGWKNVLLYWRKSYKGLDGMLVLKLWTRLSGTVVLRLKPPGAVMWALTADDWDGLISENAVLGEAKNSLKMHIKSSSLVCRSIYPGLSLLNLNPCTTEPLWHLTCRHQKMQSHGAGSVTARNSILNKPSSVTTLACLVNLTASDWPFLSSHLMPPLPSQSATVSQLNIGNTKPIFKDFPKAN